MVGQRVRQGQAVGVDEVVALAHISGVGVLLLLDDELQVRRDSVRGFVAFVHERNLRAFLPPWTDINHKALGVVHQLSVGVVAFSSNVELLRAPVV